MNAYRWLRGRLNCLLGTHVKPHGRASCRYCDLWLMGGKDPR